MEKKLIKCFFNSIISDAPVKVGAIDGLNAVKIALTAKKSLETGKPVIAAFHVPMAVDTIIEPTVKVWGKTYLMNVSEELAKKYNCIYTIADAPTAEFCRLLAESENVIGVFAGHVHLNDCGEFGNGKTQIVSHIGVCDFATAVTFLPM